MGRWNSFSAPIPKVLEIKEKNPYIAGVTIKFLWKDINPAKNEYNFE